MVYLTRWLIPSLLVCAAAASPNEQTGQKARALLAEGRIEELLAELPALEQQAKTNVEAKFALGEILQELAAIRAAELQRVAPGSLAAHELAGKSLEARGKLTEALSEYRAALSKNANSPGLNFLVGNAEWKLRNFEAARTALLVELKLNPHHAAANLRMGEIALDANRDNPKDAVKYLREATNGAPDSLEAHRELGKALRIDGQYREAIEHLQFVALKAPNDDSVHAQLAALYRNTGELGKAAEEMKIHSRILRERLEASQRVRR